MGEWSKPTFFVKIHFLIPKCKGSGSSILEFSLNETFFCRLPEQTFFIWNLSLSVQSIVHIQDLELCLPSPLPLLPQLLKSPIFAAPYAFYIILNIYLIMIWWAFLYQAKQDKTSWAAMLVWKILPQSTSLFNPGVFFFSDSFFLDFFWPIMIVTTNYHVFHFRSSSFFDPIVNDWGINICENHQQFSFVFLLLPFWPRTIVASVSKSLCNKSVLFLFSGPEVIVVSVWQG